MICPICKLVKDDVYERVDMFTLEVYGRTQYGVWCGNCEKEMNADI